MKRFILMAIMLLPVSLMAQIPQFSKMAEKYSDNDTVTSMTVNKQMMAMFAGDNEMMEYLDEIQILLTSDTANANKILAESKKIVKRIDAEELISANDGGETFSIYTIKEGSNVTNIIIVADCTATSDESGVIIVSGSIPEDMLSEVVNVINQ